MDFFSSSSAFPWRTLLIICLGQSLSLFNASSQIFSEKLVSVQANIPSFRLTMVYFLLFLYLPLHYYLYGLQKRPLKTYAILLVLAFIDIEANYFVVKAFDTSYYVTVGLLLNFTLIFSSILGYLFLDRRYTKNHLVGCVVSLSGLLLIFFDSFDENDSRQQNSYIGNCYVILATVLYSISNIIFEVMLKSKDASGAEIEAPYTLEFLGSVGFGGVVLGALQTWALETDQIAAVQWSSEVILYSIGFVVVVVAFYTISSYFLIISDSSFLNLSLLTADIINVIVSYCIFQSSLSISYWIALFLNIAGIILYSLRPVQDMYQKHTNQKDDFIGLRDKQTLV